MEAGFSVVLCANGISWDQNLGHLAVKCYAIQSANLSPYRSWARSSPLPPCLLIQPQRVPARNASGMCKSPLGLPW